MRCGFKMARAITITTSQASALRSLYYADVMSASDSDRSALEQLVDRGYAVKGNVGRAVTYRITPQGKAVYKAL